MTAKVEVEVSGNQSVEQIDEKDAIDVVIARVGIACYVVKVVIGAPLPASCR
jgi:hypothetical protein